MAACGKRGAPTARPILSRAICPSGPARWRATVPPEQPFQRSVYRGFAATLVLARILKVMAEPPVETERANGEPPIHRTVLDAPSWMPTEKFTRNVIIGVL